MCLIQIPQCSEEPPHNQCFVLCKCYCDLYTRGWQMDIPLTQDIAASSPWRFGCFLQGNLSGSLNCWLCDHTFDFLKVYRTSQYMQFRFHQQDNYLTDIHGMNCSCWRVAWSSAALPFNSLNRPAGVEMWLTQTHISISLVVVWRM